MQAFIHLSTAFCHGDLEVLEEKLYPPPANPHDIIRSTQWMDQDVIDMITPKLLGCHPNCYTYSKRLAESLVEEYASRLPACVMRPSIVTPIIQDPVRGWVDTLNGPVGVLVGAGKGVIRSMLCDGDKKAEMVPVDIVANSVIVAATQISTSPRGVVSVFNVTSADKNPYSWSEVVEKGKQVVHEYPFEAGLWYPNGSITMNPYSHALTVLMVQTIPAYLIDLLMIIIRQKRLVRVQRRIADGTHLLKFFTTRKWNFINKKALGLVDHLNERDQKIFYMGNVDYDVEQYFKDMIIGSRIYCMKEPLETLEKARRQLKM
ncbi:hypothetical protein AAG570_009699 [Ranatra chinensis]|uniref:Fatty acyl-CoA reductase n=1 Tax=Ranatra chinensis TaxID=642074 RepID=A0ABD0YRZ2_9HEMI